MREEIAKILEIKKALYCSVCDLRLSSHLDTQNNQIKLSDNFCFQMLKNSKKYLIWKNKIFLEYVEKLYQYLMCHASGG